MQNQYYVEEGFQATWRPMKIGDDHQLIMSARASRGGGMAEVQSCYPWTQSFFFFF